MSMPEIVKYYPIFKFSEPSGTAKTEVMNKYFIMTSAPIVNEDKNAVLT